MMLFEMSWTCLGVFQSDECGKMLRRKCNSSWLKECRVRGVQFRRGFALEISPSLKRRFIPKCRGHMKAAE